MAVIIWRGEDVTGEDLTQCHIVCHKSQEETNLDLRGKRPETHRHATEWKVMLKSVFKS